ncbi:hypothetical protein [uncultured Methanomethylovorans sp.]|uniref:hypothetical protein n=1 Tax=uncultured Methanomethylovorans sp. TaxID=183759 RepID=UPI002AA8D05B|nr:hypothetical protein [uncultured Methanomethylovorans sp.]
MKVRLEIIDEDGTTRVNVEFTGAEWQKCLVSFIESFSGKGVQASGPSSASVANYKDSFQQAVSQTPPQVNSQPYHQSPSQFFPGSVVQQVQPVMQQQVLPSFVPAQQPSVYQYPSYAQYQQMVSPLKPSFSQVPSQYSVPLQSPSLQPVVNQYMPVNNTSQQSRQTQVKQEQPVIPTRNTPSFQERVGGTKLTINERLELFLKYEYPRVWFSSQAIQQHYEKIYGPIKLSTVSTYLSRMFGKNLLERRGNRTQREYRYISDESTELQAPEAVSYQSMI